jgi:hypothetical protein
MYAKLHAQPSKYETLDANRVVCKLKHYPQNEQHVPFVGIMGI